jgi:hypothetical protein
LCLLALVLLAFEACRAPALAAPSGDTLRDLAAAVEAAEVAAPLALAACGLATEEHRPACRAGAEALDRAAVAGRQVLATVEACEEGDAACVEAGLEAARELLQVLRPSPSPAPSGSAP